jgi:hypothetical protein
MTTDFRALCAELLVALEIQLDELRFDNRLCKRARAALAAPEQGPTDEELISTYQSAYEPAWKRGEYSGCHVDGLRAVLARWGRPAVEPVPAIADFDKLPNGFYWITHKACPSDHSLIRLYTNPDTAQRGVGFGIWDGCAFVPLSDLTEHTVLTLALPLPQEGADGQH